MIGAARSPGRPSILTQWMSWLAYPNPYPTSPNKRRLPHEPFGFFHLFECDEYAWGLNDQENRRRVYRPLLLLLELFPGEQRQHPVGLEKCSVPLIVVDLLLDERRKWKGLTRYACSFLRR